MTGRAPLLVVEGLTKAFGGGRTFVRAVSDVDLATEIGEITLVMGPSGSGKTTLLTMIGGLLRPTAGRVAVDGLELTALGERELPAVRRRLVGFVFQTFNLLEALTARENVEIALNVAGVKGLEARERARALLVRSGLEERLDFSARDLSAGEKQRVAISRALANRPRLLLADEPTANLDTEGGREVMTLLRALTDGGENGAVVVSHDPRLEEIADRVVTLADGRVVARRDRRCGISARALVEPTDARAAARPR
jgi:putative ABC transport system ATP-binding protein